MCFRLKGTDKINEKLLSNINASGKLHMVPANVNDKYVVRFCAVAQNATEADIGKDGFIQFRNEYVLFLNIFRSRMGSHNRIC